MLTKDKMLIEIECESQLSEIIKGSGNTLVVVDCYAQWCHPCKVIVPFLKQLEVEFPDIKFIKVDIDEYEEFAESESVDVTPTLLFYKGGKRLGHISGTNKEKLREYVVKYRTE